MAYTPTTAQRFRGAGGLWNDPTLEREVISLVPFPKRGILSYIPSIVSNVDVQKFAYISKMTLGDTDLRDGSETQCGDCTTAGLEYNCFQKQPWGTFCISSANFDLKDYAMKYTNLDREEELVLVNPMPDGELPTVSLLNRSFTNAMSQGRSLVGYKALYQMHRTAWYGNPVYNRVANNRMTYGEWYGLHYLINTNHVDEGTGTTCSALDSHLPTWTGGDIMANADVSARYVYWLASQLRYLWSKADNRGFGMNPESDWLLTMTDEAFFAHTRIWPCAYMSTHCSSGVPTGFLGGIDINSISEQGSLLNPDRMYNERYLMLFGKRIPVVIDDMINETQNGDGTFTSGIYYVPWRYLGNRSALYFKFLNYDGPMGVTELAGQLGLAKPRWTTSDGGRFLWTLDNEKTCYNWQLETKPSLVFKLPNVAMRFDVTYQVEKHTEDVWPGMPYWEDGGGVYERPLPTNLDIFGNEFQHTIGGGANYNI